MAAVHEVCRACRAPAFEAVRDDETDQIGSPDFREMNKCKDDRFTPFVHKSGMASIRRWWGDTAADPSHQGSSGT